MSTLNIINAKPRRATLEAVITRADGSVENLGTIAYYHRNALRRWLVNALISIRRLLQ
jgi:hypothetical protein